MYRCQVQRNTVEVYLSKTKKKIKNQTPHTKIQIKKKTTSKFLNGKNIFNENQKNKTRTTNPHLLKKKLFIALIYFIEPELREFKNHSLFISLSLSLFLSYFICFESFISVEERFKWLKKLLCLFVCYYLFMCNQIYFFYRFQILTTHIHTQIYTIALYSYLFF